MNYTIEPANPSDRDGILKVMSHFGMHHVPSVEMDELDLSCFFVARMRGNIVGAAGYKLLAPGQGKTTLLGVLPECSGMGIGKDLQHKRMEVMHKKGVKTLTTNADRPDTILWYKKHYGYRQVGTLKKLCPFGLENVDHWTTLQTDLDAYFKGLDARDQRKREFMARNDAHPLSPYPPLVINVCLTGMIPTRAQTPHVPLSPEEIIEAAIDAYDAGARLAHLHARDAEGLPTPDPSYYDKIIRGIRRERPGMICCATTSGRNWSDFERRSAVLYLDEAARPEMASLTLGSLNFLTNPSTNSIEMVERLAMAMKEQGVKPELEVFDLGMVNLARYLERNGVIGGRKYFNLLLGNLNTAPATIGNLATLVAALPENSVWAGAGIGQFQLPMNAAAVVAGGHVRVGLEDSIFFDYAKTQLATNRQLIERVVRIAAELQRPIATPNEARATALTGATSL
jgi:3-keto-5-aminohexanoate cleavage enzyme